MWPWDTGLGLCNPENKLRPGQGNEEGNEVLASATSASTPLNVQGEHFQSALDGHFNSPFPAEKELFLRLAFERTITPSHCPSPIFFPLMKKKGGNRSLRKQRKRLSPGPGLSHQSSVGGEEVRPGVRMGAARSQAAC